VYEDEQVLAFQDIHPIAPVHFLLIPKEHVPTLSETQVNHEAVLGRMMVLAPRLAREQGADDGFRLIVNTGRVGRQEVFHVHMHILGGKEPLGPMLPRPKT
jgi:histidine triad (HIT) family protein